MRTTMRSAAIPLAVFAPQPMMETYHATICRIPDAVRVHRDARLRAGYFHQSFEGPSVTAIAGVDSLRGQTHSGTGVVYGGQLGYDWRSGQTVYGVEGEITGGTTKNCYTHVTSPTSTDGFCDKADRDLYIGGRIGRVVGDSTLVYAKAGYTNFRTDFDYRDGGTGAGNYSGGSANDGYRVGAGVEQAVSRNLIVKAEYRYSHYENGYGRHQGVVGLGFRF